MEMKEICIERVANGFVIECEYKQKEKGAKAGMTMGYSEGRKMEYIAVNEEDVLKKVKKLLGKLAGGMESGES